MHHGEEKRGCRSFTFTEHSFNCRAERDPEEENDMNAIARFVCACSVLTVLGLSVEASDKKIYPASSCQVSSESGGGVAFYNNQGRIYNDSAIGALTLLCPIVRDSTVSGLRSVSVVVRNPQPEGVHDVNVVCTLENREANGTLFKTQERFLPASTNSGWTTLTFDSLPAVDGGYHLLVCRFPQRLGSLNTGITSYTVTEEEDD
jgi:hypothetical protein